MPTHHTQSRGSHPTSKYNKNYNGSAESEEIALLKNKYSSELPTLRELFPTWSEEDILFTLQENQGDLMLTIDRISEGFATQWDEVKTAKPKKEAFTTPNTRNQQQQFVQDKTKHKAPVSTRGPKNGPGSSGKKFSNQDAATIEKNFQELRLNSETTAWDEQPTNDGWDNANNQDSWGKSKSHHSKSGHQTSKGKGQGNKNKTEVKEEPPKPAVKSWASIVKPKAAEPAKPKAPTQPPKPEPIENKQEQEPKVSEVPLEDKKEEILPVEQATEPELDSEVAQPEQVETAIPAPTMEFPSADVVPEIPQIPEQQQIPAPVPSSIPVPASVPVSQNASGVKFGNFQSNTNFTSGNAPSFGSLNFSQAPRANLPPGLSLPNQVPPSSRPSQPASTLPASVPYSRPAQQAQEQTDASASPNTRQSAPQAQQATSQAPLSRGPAPGNLNNAYNSANASQFVDNKSPFPNYYHPSKFNPHQRPNVGIPPAYSQQYAHPQQSSYQQHNSVPYPTAQFEYHQQNDTTLLSNPAKKESPAVESNTLNSASSATAQPPSVSSANSSTQQHSYHPQSNETLSHSHPQQQQQQQFQHHQPHFNHNIYQQHSQYYHDSYMHTQPYNPYTYDPYTQHYSQPHYQPQQYQSGYTHPSAGNYAHPSSRSNKPFWTTKH